MRRSELMTSPESQLAVSREGQLLTEKTENDCPESRTRRLGRKRAAEQEKYSKLSARNGREGLYRIYR